MQQQTPEEAAAAQKEAVTSLDEVFTAAKNADKKAEPTPDPKPVHKDGLLMRKMQTETGITTKITRLQQL